MTCTIKLDDLLLVRTSAPAQASSLDPINTAAWGGDHLLEGSLGGTRALLAVFCAGLHLLDMSRGALQLPTHQHTGHRFLHAFKALIRYHLSSILVSHGMLSTGMSLQVTMKM